MRTIKNPRQNTLFDPFARVLDPRAYKRLLDGWHGVFRHVILEALADPVRLVARRFSADRGAPSKEIYSMVGLLLIKEFMDWTTEQAVNEYTYNASIQYALNMEPAGQYVTERTLERYAKRVVEEELAAEVFDAVTSRLIEALDLKVERQRLDSTHVLSDMATFGRTRLMAVTIKRFLRQVKRHAPEAFKALPEELRKRYAKSDQGAFGDMSNSEKRQRLRQEVAEEMCFLVEEFAENPDMRTWTSYKALVRVFLEQCEVNTPKSQVEGAEPTVKVKKKTGGNVIQNPSDPDATYDGHKGPGYKTQLAETCHEENEVQLLTGALPQTAVVQDALSLEPMVDCLNAADRKPEELAADAAYGSDSNDRKCREEGIDLVSPALSGSSEKTAAKANHLAEFEFDPSTGEVLRCPAGHAPESSRYNPETEKTYVSMSAQVCEGCALLAMCPVGPHRKRYVGQISAKMLRLARRRRYEQGEEFKRRYAARAGLEATNSSLKRRTGLGRVRVRGGPRVFYAILMKCAGWNVLRAAASATLRAKVVQRARDRVLSTLILGLHRLLHGSFGSSVSGSGLNKAQFTTHALSAAALPLPAA